MNTITTEGIEISVYNKFNKQYSNIHENIFFHNYIIEIKNTSSNSVQLLSREWFINDSLNSLQTVKGKGVIGKQPILQANEVFKYESGCKLQSEIGYMVGKYQFINLSNNSLFDVEIPKFELVYPFKMN